MRGRAAATARFAIRPLLPGPEEALRGSLLSLGVGPAAFPVLAHHGGGEALAVQGLAPDETRVVERELTALGGAAVVAADAGRVLLLGPLDAMGELPARLRAFGRRTEALADAIQAAMAGKGSRRRWWDAGGSRLPTGERTVVMGIVNATPDSFSGDGVGDDVAAAVARGVAMVEAGAGIVDVGGESTRPHSVPVPLDEELRRVLPVVEALAARLPVPVSIDTRHARVAERAIAAGARVVNDIRGLRGDPRMAPVCAAAGVGVVLMHNRRGSAGTDLLAEVVGDLSEGIGIAESAGVDLERVVVDPGLGFGKTPAENLEVLRRLGELRGLGRPILVGASRKSTIGLLLRDADGRPAPPDRRLEGTLALHTLAVAAGADLLRVHDVGEAVRAARVADAVVRGTPPFLLAEPAPGPTG